MRTKALALLLLGLVVPAVCSAQSIKSGTWTGTAVSPDGKVEPLTFDVTVAGDSLGIVIHAGEHGDFIITDARYSEKTIRFTFTPRIEFHCALTLNPEGTYAGDCLETDGTAAQMTMVPPKRRIE